ncbi:virion component [Haloarcula sinaiiensis tailed virus 1]|uniref:Virion component n=1 Tax=Haloarcula sinaiiensis tailed virus 1 TaxID=1262530 RepID=R9QT70_9CAUD|nr:virion component [Haloarcula sinaiiensis tailed virus 1]AGC34574.1 virion component [Haloarcula sinaiiensis tailed virus 1]
MAGERRLNWGSDATDAKWRSEHDTANGKFIIAEDTDGGTVLLEYDESASEFVSRGPVNMNGNAIESVSQIGSDTDRFTGFMDNADTEELQYAANNTGYSGRLTDRPLVSTQDRDITVGTDTSTIQEALNEIPLLLRHNFAVRVPDGTYDEDLLVPPVVIEDTAGLDDAGAGSDEGASQIPWIRGNTTTPTNVTVNSITVSSTQGAIAPIIEGFNPISTIPNSDENVAVAVFGAQNVSFRHLDFSGAGANIGFLIYSSTATIRGATDFGSGDLNRGVEMKHNGMLSIDTFGGKTTGTVNDYLVRNDDGSVVVIERTDATGGSGLINNVHGIAHNTKDHIYYPRPAFERAIGSGSDQTVADKTETTVKFDTTTTSRYGNWDTANYEFNPPKPGEYTVTAQVQFIGPSSGTKIQVILTGSGWSRVSTENISSGGNPTVKITDTQNLTRNDTVRVNVRHEEGSGLDINTDNQEFTFVSVQRNR